MSFGVIADGQTYRNLAYLIIAFPLATFYFTFAVTVISVGASLVWTFVGLVILAFGLSACRAFMAIECSLAEKLTRRRMPLPTPAADFSDGFWRGVWSLLKQGDSWLSLLFLLVRFPLAVAAFSVAISLVGASLWAIVQPVLAPLFTWIGIPQEWGAWTIDTVWEGFIFFPIGVVLLFLSLHAVNAIAWLMAESVRLMTGRIGHLRMRRQLLGMLAGGRVLDGASLLRDLHLFNGFSIDINPINVYATLLGLKSAGLADSSESDGVEWFTLTPRGERAAAGRMAVA